MADFENLKSSRAGMKDENYPGEFIIYFIADCNYMVEGVMASCLINPSERQRNLRPMRKEKNLFDTKDYILDLMTVRKKETTCPKKAVI